MALGFLQRSAQKLLGLSAVIVWLCGCDAERRSPAVSSGVATVPAPVEVRICGTSAKALADAPWQQLLPASVGAFCRDPHSDPWFFTLTTDSSLDECSAILGERCEELAAQGARAVAVVRYIDERGLARSVDVRLLRFATTEGAFAYHTRSLLRDQHPQALHAEPVDEHAVLAHDKVLLFGGRQLAEGTYHAPQLTASKRQHEGAVVLRNFALALKERISAPVPDSVARLPRQNRLQFGVRYVRDDALGIRGAGPGATGYYQRAGLSYRIFFNNAGDEGAARDIERTLRTATGYHQLKDMPFGAFELLLDEDGVANLWLVARHQDHIAAIGDDFQGQPPRSNQERQERAMSRGNRAKLLRRVMTEARAGRQEAAKPDDSR